MSEIKVSRPGVVLRKRVARKAKRCAVGRSYNKGLFSYAVRKLEGR